MTRIEATCPICGPVECTADAFELQICSHSASSYYVFVCPSCADRIQKPATEKVIEVLISEGITPGFWDLPAEMLEVHDGPPINMDDLIDMHALLQQPDWFELLSRVDT